MKPWKRNVKSRTSYASLAWVLVLASLLFAVAAAPATPLSRAAGNSVAAAAQNASSDGITVNPNSSSKKSPDQQAAEQRAVEQYWTPERMRNAEPYPAPVVSGNVTAGRSAPAPTGPSGFIAATLPSIKADMRGAADADVSAANSGAGNMQEPAAPQAPTGYSYPGPYTRYTIPGVYYTDWPYITVGKMFFTQLGHNYVCSGSSLGKNSVWTAGHCVHAGNNSGSGWSYNMFFVPAHNNGAAPVGTWVGGTSAVLTSWYNSSANVDSDMGAFEVARKNGLRLSQVVGNLGFAWNFNREHHWNMMGYPQASPFNGKYMVTCESSFAYTLNGGTGVDSSVAGCDQTGGSSGGPWIMYFGTGNYINGHNDWERVGYPQEMASPYFDNRARDLRALAITWGP